MPRHIGTSLPADATTCPDSLVCVSTGRRVDRSRRQSYGVSQLPNGATVSVWGWLGWWLFCTGFAALGLEAALMIWGAGSWPVPDIPWISIGLMGVGMAVVLVDVLVVDLHDRRVLLRSDIDARLMAQLPELAARHADLGWRVRPVAGRGFVVDLWPALDPARVARVRVEGRRWRASRDLSLSFGGFEGHRFSVPFQFTGDALGELLSQVANIVRGPTVVTVERAGADVVRTSLRCGPDPTRPWIEETGETRPFRRLLWRLQGNHLEHDVHAFPDRRH